MIYLEIFHLNPVKINITFVGIPDTAEKNL